MGSPPRGRGKVSCTYTAICSKGITPAWAGKRPVRAILTSWQMDHPRVGREKARTLIVQDEPQGSPPRRRGKGIQLTHKGLLDGITPAWAGKRALCWNGVYTHRDHPRVGGEKAPQGQRLNLILGSPPRGRGKEHYAGTEYTPIGITPAWAGKRPRRGSALT